MKPAEAIRRLGAPLHDARVLRRLHAGQLKTVWLLARGSERWVLRVDEPGAAGFVPDRRVEFEIQAAAAAAGLAPEPLAFLPGPPAVLLSRHAPGRAWRPADLALPDRAEALGRLLRRLHQAALPGPLLDLERQIDGYARMLPASEARKLRQPALRWLARAVDGSPPVLCHNDPTLGNVIGFRRSWLIDWEYAARGDPLFDLAVLACHHALPPATLARIAAACLGGSGQIPWQRLDAWRHVYDHLLCLWLMALRQKTVLDARQQGELAMAKGRLAAAPDPA